MSNFEVLKPILNSPFDEPQTHWWIVEGETPAERPGRRPAMYYYREPRREQNERGGVHVELMLENLIRERVKAWRAAAWPGVTRTTHDLLAYWRREGREKRLFFAQIEAAETIIFLTEARADFRQGIEVPRDEPSDAEKTAGYAGFVRYACKMATGSGKTTVMGLLAAWTILNKVMSRGDARFSDVVLIVCPNVTIRSRLAELQPEMAEASLYCTRDLVPEHLMGQLRQGKVLVTNWHVFEPQMPHTAGDGGRVVRTGVPVQTTETIRIGDKNDTKRGTRWLTRATLFQQIANGLIEVVDGDPDSDVSLKVRSVRYVESDTAVVNRLLRGVGGKRNIFVMNDEAHHAYRVKVERPGDWETMDEDERVQARSSHRDGVIVARRFSAGTSVRSSSSRIATARSFGATSSVATRRGRDLFRGFPALKCRAMCVRRYATLRDTTGAEIPRYFNIWQWIMEPGRLTAGERGGRRANPKPEAILKWANTPIAMLGGLWNRTLEEWRESAHELRPPVFILVCKSTALANVIYEWLANGVNPSGIPPSNLPAFRNTGFQPVRTTGFQPVADERRQDARGPHRQDACATNTIVVHAKVVHDTDSGAAKSDEARWMRLTLDTVGRREWPRDSQQREIFQEGFAELAEKLGRPLHPPGRDVRCIVSVGMLTEGWDGVPDFIVRLPGAHVLLETKGYDPLREVKQAAAMRWCAAINANGQFGRWDYRLVDAPEKVVRALDEVLRSKTS